MNKKVVGIGLLAMTVMLYSCKPKFKKLKGGMQYMIVKKGKGDKSIKEGDIITMTVKTKLRDSVIFDSYAMNNGKPIETMVSKPMFNGDPMEAFLLLKEGDSAVVQCVADSLFRDQMPPFAKSGDKVTIAVRMVKAQTKDDFQKNMEKESQVQKTADDKLIQDYFTKQNITNAQKTASGLYYVINTPGSGANAQSGQEVTINYTGKLLDGTTFDSNQEEAFGHKEAFKFPLGVGKVIRGWDEGIALLNKGSKATLYIPSGIAYGPQAMPGNPNNPKGIPANSVLMFNVEVVNIANMPKPKEGEKGNLPPMPETPPTPPTGK